MKRKYVVMIEWAVLLLLAAGLAVFCIRRLFSSGTTGTPGQTAEQSAAAQAEAGQGGADADGTAAASGDSSEGGAASGEKDTPGAGAAAGSGEEPGELLDPTPPEARRYTLSFAGDCTIGSLVEWQGSEPGDFQSVVGSDYAYPLSGVRSYFSTDDFTMVNLEGTFTNSDNAVEKPYRFRADPAYVQVLSEGSVEAVSASNNHSGDFQEEGIIDTLSTLDNAGILYARAGAPLIHRLRGGLSLGIVSYNTVENWESEDVWRSAVYTDIETCKAAGCDLIIGFMHWGTVEYLEEPEDWEVDFAHDMADWGCGLIVGGHAHILQRMEYYNNVPIFYSMGNFCYGGHLNPSDKDTIIVQAEYTWNSGTGELSRSGLRVIPCLISSREDVNNYCPTPCEKGSEDYERILGRLEWTG